MEYSTTNTEPLTPETPAFQKLDLDPIREMGRHLYLSMLRFYREEGLLEKWRDIDKKLEGLYQHLSPEQIAFLHYERTLYALFALDVPEVKTQIKAWPSNESLPFWETKRAGLLAEIGQVEDADKILEQSLRSIRSKLNLKPVTTDYSLVSQEAFTMLLLHYVGSSDFQKNRLWSENQPFKERWNALKQYNCDPWNEFKLFENHLEREPVEKPAVYEKKDFDIGLTTQTRYFGGNNKEAISAYAFLRLCEEVGIPFRISALHYAIKVQRERSLESPNILSIGHWRQ